MSRVATPAALVLAAVLLPPPAPPARGAPLAGSEEERGRIHRNLGAAYLRAGVPAQAAREFARMVDAGPAAVFLAERNTREAGGRAPDLAARAAAARAAGPFPSPGLTAGTR